MTLHCAIASGKRQLSYSLKQITKSTSPRPRAEADTIASMLMTKQWRNWVARLACVAMLLSALMPTLSHALAPDRVATLLAEICSPGTARTVDADGKAPVKKQMNMEDCSYCRLQFDTPVLPSVPPALIIADIVAHHPPLYYQSPAPLFSWISANPRGPPVLS